MPAGDLDRATALRRTAVALALATLLKLVLIVPAEGLPLRGDERQYVAGAMSIAATGIPVYLNPVWDEAHSSPLYPYGLALLFRVFGPAGGSGAALVAQVLLGTFTALFVYAIATRIHGRRNAWISATVTAFFPTFIAYSQYFYTETLYTFLFVGVAALLLQRSEPPSPATALAAGLVAGLAALTRGAFVIQAPFVVLWLVCCTPRPARTRVLRAGLFVLGMALAIAPWTVRNAVRYEHLLLIDTNGGNVLYKNWNVIRQENHDVGLDRRWKDDREAYSGAIPFRERVEADDPVERNRLEMRAAVRFTLAHPLLFARNSVIRAAELVNPTSFLVRSIRRGDYAGLPPLAAEAIVWSVLLSTMAVLVFGALGLAARPPTDAARLPLLMVLGNVVICVLIVSMSRYRLPMMPLLIPFAVDGAWRARTLARERPPGFWVALAVVAAMVVAWIPYVPLSL